MGPCRQRHNRDARDHPSGLLRADLSQARYLLAQVDQSLQRSRVRVPRFGGAGLDQPDERVVARHQYLQLRPEQLRVVTDGVRRMIFPDQTVTS